jgi:predicted dithiol-disulfide oxidoreductase (DUF899 family)
MSLKDQTAMSGCSTFLEGRRQLILYHFMFAPRREWLAHGRVPGLLDGRRSYRTLEHLHARDTSLVLVRSGRLANLEAYKQRMGWKVPWVSSAGTTFNKDFRPEQRTKGETFWPQHFLRDGDTIYHTYFTSDRGIEVAVSSFIFLDWTPFVRQENWEDSPARLAPIRNPTNGGAATMSIEASGLARIFSHAALHHWCAAFFLTGRVITH